MNDQRARWLAGLSIAAAILGGGGALALFSVPVSQIYSLEATFDQLPDDDHDLARCLRRHPGIVRQTVHVDRVGFEQKRLRVTFLQVRTWAGHPAFPELERFCAALDYVGPATRFVDCPPPSP